MYLCANSSRAALHSKEIHSSCLLKNDFLLCSLSPLCEYLPALGCDAGGEEKPQISAVAMLACDSVLSFAFSLEPCSSSLPTDTRQYPVFVGHKPGRNTTQRHRLDIQLVTVMNRTLYIAARSVVLCFTTPHLLCTEREGEEEGYSEFSSAGHVILRIFSHSYRGLQALSKMYWTPC